MYLARRFPSRHDAMNEWQSACEVVRKYGRLNSAIQDEKNRQFIINCSSDGVDKELVFKW